ncbi:unnamed protein product [Absidia cylindrospora]
MGLRVFWLTLIRVLLVITSAGTLACHSSQIALLGNNYWFPHNYSYILYFVGPGVSTISSSALLFTMVCGIKSIRGDRFTSIFNLALMIATVAIGTVKTGFQSNCSGGEFKRCWLSNGAWIGAIVVAAFWLLLVLYVFIQRSSDIFQNSDEYEVYDFKNTGHNSIPMAVTSQSPIVSSLKQQQLHDQPPSHHGDMTSNDYNQAYYDPAGYVDYGQQQQYGLPPPNYGNHQQQPPHQYDAYGPSDAYNNNGGYGYYVPPESSLATPVEQYTNNTPNGSHADDDTAHIMADIGGVDHRSRQSPPHTPSKSHQVPHTYD